MKLSARNQIKGTVVSIERGVVNDVVKIEVAPGIVITPSITNASIEELRFEEGVEAYVVIKASNAIVGVED